MAFNFENQINLLKLRQNPAFSSLIERNPELPFKYLVDGYIINQLSPKIKGDILYHNYIFLEETIDSSYVCEIFSNSIIVYRSEDDGGSIEIALGGVDSVVSEGELSLVFKIDGRAVYVLSFTIAPGYLSQRRAADVLLISRIQGEKGAFAEISRATALLNDVDPSMALVAALQGFASALGIVCVIAVPARDLQCYPYDDAERFHRNYDAFYASLGMSRAGVFFESSLPLPEKPIGAIKSNHRSRTKKKRAIRNGITQEVRESMSRMRRSTKTLSIEPLGVERRAEALREVTAA